MYEYLETNEDEVPFIGPPFPPDSPSTIWVITAKVEDVDGYNLYMAQGAKWNEGDPVDGPGTPYGEYYKVNKNLITEDDKWDGSCEPEYLDIRFMGTHNLYHYSIYATSVKDGVESEPSPNFILRLGFVAPDYSCPELP